MLPDLPTLKELLPQAGIDLKKLRKALKAWRADALNTSKLMDPTTKTLEYLELRRQMEAVDTLLQLL